MYAPEFTAGMNDYVVNCLQPFFLELQLFPTPEQFHGYPRIPHVGEIVSHSLSKRRPEGSRQTGNGGIGCFWTRRRTSRHGET